MVQMTQARTYNPQTRQWGTMTAKAYTQKRAHYRALEEAGELECHCPDPHCTGVKLTHYKDRLHTYYSPEGQPYRLEIPSYFQRAQGAPAHHPDCEIVREYGAYQRHARLEGATSFGHGIFLFNLNIPVMQSEGPVRAPRAPLGDSFAPVVSRGERSEHRSKRKLSEGLKDLPSFGRLLEKAAYDPMFRRTLLFRKGAATYHLEDLYKETPLDVFRAAQNAARAGTGLATAITAFKPAALPQFWRRGKTGPGAIYGQPASVRGNDGAHYHVNTVLHVENRDLYARIKEQFHGGAPSFLVYSEKIYIDHAEIQARNAHAAQSGENTAFHVHVHVTRPEQIVPWAIPGANKELDLQLPAPAARVTHAAQASPPPP